ncbi:MAG: LysR family transcriptional regulator [Proteobacteria bacterium]|nr:LysR family transcriptional regulator [Pseudomonadota bacterium]
MLRVLVALLDCRGVSRAARILDRSQPATSAVLQRLRQRFDDQLFVRSGGSMQPTPRAEALGEAARAVLQVVDTRMNPTPDFDPAVSERPVSLAMSDVGEVIFLPAILQLLRSEMPTAAVRSVSRPAAQLAEGLESGDIDLAVGYFPDLGGRNFMQQVLFRDRYTCLIRADHPVRSDPLTARQFSQLQHAVVRVESRTEEVMERYLARRRIARRIALTTPHFASAPLIVAQSDLVVSVPEPLARYFAKTSANLRVVGLPFEPPAIDLKQIWHRRFNNDPRSRWLRARIYAQFRGRRVQ